MAGSGKAVVVFHVKVAIGLFCWSKAVVEAPQCASRRVLLSLGEVRSGSHGKVCLGEVRFVFVRQLRLGVSWRGALWFCKAVVASMAAHVAVTCRPLRLGSLGS